MYKKDFYVNILAHNSKTDCHELITDCLNYYNVCGIRDLTVFQLHDFCKLKGLI